MKRRLAVLLGLLLLLSSLPLSVHGQTAPGRRPVGLGVTVVPQTLPADGNVYPALVISVVDASGAPTISLSDVLVYLSSSSESAASTPQTATLPAGHGFVQVDVTTSTTPGTTTITAAASGLESKSVSVSTVAPGTGASSLGLFVSPSPSLHAIEGTDAVYVVQLENVTGRPGASKGTTNVVITCSNSSLIGSPIDVSIPPGATMAYGSITVNRTGTATLTALAPRLVTANAQLQVSSALPTLTLTVTPTLLSSGDTADVSVAVQLLGMPLVGARVNLTASSGTLVPANFVTNTNGQGRATYISQFASAVTISAVATYTQLGVRLTGSTAVLVVQPTATTTTSNDIGSTLSLYVPIIAVVVAAAAIVLVVRRTLRKRRGVADEDEEFERPEEKKPNQTVDGKS